MADNADLIANLQAPFSQTDGCHADLAKELDHLTDLLFLHLQPPFG